MINTVMKSDIDAENKVERNIDGCKVRLFFSVNQNDKIERLVLDNLMLAFDRKVQGLSIVKT